MPITARQANINQRDTSTVFTTFLGNEIEPPWIGAQGGGTGTFGLVNSESGRVGIAALGTGANAAGGYSIRLGYALRPADFFEIEFEASVRIVTALPDATNNWGFLIGLMDNAFLDNGGALGLQLENGQSNALRYRTHDSSIIHTNSGIVAALNTWYDFSLQVRGTQARFRINGGNEFITTTQVPQTKLLSPCFVLQKRAGTTGRTVHIDHLKMRMVQ